MSNTESIATVEWISVDVATPPDGTWCWVWNGDDVWPALRDQMAVGGWSNHDTWEDFDKAVTHWQLIPCPEPPP